VGTYSHETCCDVLVVYVCTNSFTLLPCAPVSRTHVQLSVAASSPAVQPLCPQPATALPIHGHGSAGSGCDRPQSRVEAAGVHYARQRGSQSHSQRPGQRGAQPLPGLPPWPQQDLLPDVGYAADAQPATPAHEIHVPLAVAEGSDGVLQALTTVDESAPVDCAEVPTGSGQPIGSPPAANAATKHPELQASDAGRDWAAGAAADVAAPAVATSAAAATPADAPKMAASEFGLGAGQPTSQALAVEVAQLTEVPTCVQIIIDAPTGLHASSSTEAEPMRKL
jgi:hypothetical protein